MALEKLTSPQYESFIRKCWQKTGCLMTADGSDDKLIQPEGLSDYLVPPPSILDPALQPAATNTPSPATVIDDDQEEDVQMTFEDKLVERDDTADDDDCPNIFDIIDNLMIE